MSATIGTPARYRYMVFPAMALLWVLFKWAYPFADFYIDSYTYIQAAADHDAISYRPIGYSIFLRLVHTISRSDTVLVTIQFGLIQSSCWLLFRFLCRCCPPGRWARVLIAVFLVLDAPVYYISNCVSSDALFIALSLFWFTALLQLVHRPGWRILIVQWVLLLLIFYTRYVALFYPVVAAITCFRLRRDLFFRLAAIAGSAAVVTAGVLYTRAVTEKETGAPVFSAFSGWQIANNALHIYPWLPVDTTGLPPATRALAGYVDRYFSREGDSVKKAPWGFGTAYMWERSSPLHRYLDDYLRRGSGLRKEPDTAELTYFTAWHRVAPVFSQYGYLLLRRHPAAFCRYYLWPSAVNFVQSPLEVLGTYNEGKKEVDTAARDWFGYRSTLLVVCSATLQGKVCAVFPGLSIGLYAICLPVAVIFGVRRELRRSLPVFIDFFRVAGIYLLVNACFTIFASPSVYRYQVLPLILLFIFTTSGLFFVTYRKQQRHG